MKLKKAIWLILLSLPMMVSLKAQIKEGYKAKIEVQAIGTTNGTVPFWMRSNQFGSVPISGLSGSTILHISKDYLNPLNEKEIGKVRFLDWGFGFEGRANAGQELNLQLIEAYFKAKLGFLQLKAGRSKDIMGLNGDTTLSSGNFALSGNALGIPKIELSIPEYWRIPIFDGIFSIKGTFSHGWLGRQAVSGKLLENDNSNSFSNKESITYFHQKSMYIKLGKRDWRLSLIGGFNHQVFWGNEGDTYGSNFKLKPLETFMYVALGKAYGTKNVPSSKIGNQLGSIDLGIEYQLDNMKVSIYRQNFYDVGALAKLANIRDGLTGVVMSNSQTDSESGFTWKSILLELFYSKDQAGYPTSIATKSGDEDYYNNYYYPNGWSYNKLGLGNPLITPKFLAKDGQISHPFDYFINNRVVAINTGLSGKLNEWELKTKITYSRNYGTFATSIYGKSTGNKFDKPTDIPFTPVNQLSYYLESNKELANGLNVGVSVFGDQGKLLKSSFGTILKVSKRIQ